jgi:hypothetical protein
MPHASRRKTMMRWTPPVENKRTRQIRSHKFHERPSPSRPTNSSLNRLEEAAGGSSENETKRKTKTTSEIPQKTP